MPNDDPNKTGIVFACRTGNHDAVAELIRKGCYIHEEDDFGRPAIIIAALMNNTKMIQLLIDAGADPNAVSSTGETIASLATLHRNVEMEKISKKYAKKTPEIDNVNSSPIASFRR